MTDTRPDRARADPVEAAREHDVFVSYSRADRETVVGLVSALEGEGLRPWVDLEDIPPSAEWMAEIRGAIEAAHGYLVVVSPDLARSEVCAEELELARTAGKRIVPVLVSATDPGSVPGALAILNWIDATSGDLDRAAALAAEALRTDLDHVRAHTRLSVQAADWDRKGEPKALLLRGGEIATAEAVVATDVEPRVTPLQARFVQASRGAATRRQRGAVGAIAAALVVSIALSAFALLQRGEAIEQRQEAIAQRDLARSGDLSSAALAELEHDPELSLLLAIEAAQIRMTSRVENALRESVKASNIESVYRGHEGKVADVAFGPGGGALVASVGYDDVIRVWDRSSGETVKVMHSPHLVWGIAFDPRGRWVAAAVSGGIDLWDIETGRRTRHLEAPGIIYQVEFSRDGRRIVGGGSGGTILWDASSGHPLTTIPAGPGGTFGADISPDGKLIATGNGDGAVRLFDAQTGRLRHRLEGHQDLGFFVRFSPSADRVVSVAVDRTARVWDVRSGNQLASLPHSGLVQDADFFHDDFVVTSDSEGAGRIWNIASGEVAGELIGHAQHIAFLDVDDTGGRIATASDDGTVRIWRAGSGVSLLDVHREGYAWAGAFIDGDSFLTAGGTDEIEIWDAAGGELRNRIRFDGSGEFQITDLAVSADRSTIAVSMRHVQHDRTAGGSVVLEDLATGRVLSTLRRRGDAYPLTVDIDPSGERAVSFWTDGLTRVSDRDGQAVTTLGNEGKTLIGAAAYSPDGSTIALVAAGYVNMVDATTEETVSRLEAHDRPINALSFSPDGTKLATASSDGTVRIWDLDPGTITATLRGHQGRVWSVAFSPDGRYLVSTASDGTARTWTASGTLLQTFQVAEADVTSAVFSPDGAHILVTSLSGSKRVPKSVGYEEDSEGIARIYACDVCAARQELLDLAMDRVTRTLSSSERDRFGVDG